LSQADPESLFDLPAGLFDNGIVEFAPNFDMGIATFGRLVHGRKTELLTVHAVDGRRKIADGTRQDSPSFVGFPFTAIFVKNVFGSTISFAIEGLTRELERCRKKLSVFKIGPFVTSVKQLAIRKIRIFRITGLISRMSLLARAGHA
jgi:hypothetical protein